jgi:hypothetical protein
MAHARVNQPVVLGFDNAAGSSARGVAGEELSVLNQQVLSWRRSAIGLNDAYAFEKKDAILGLIGLNLGIRVQPGLGWVL